MSTDVVARPARPQIRGWAVWLLRVVVLLTTMLVLLQPVLAGMFVTGDVTFLSLHSAGAVFVAFLTLAQIVSAIIAWRPGRARAWPIWASVGFFVLVATQMGLGYTRAVAVHVPLGAFLFAIILIIFVGVWSPRFRQLKEANS